MTHACKIGRGSRAKSRMPNRPFWEGPIFLIDKKLYILSLQGIHSIAKIYILCLLCNYKKKYCHSKFSNAKYFTSLDTLIKTINLSF